MATTALPTLSEVRAFTGDYLVEAASHWADSAARWSDAYDRLTRSIARPAGFEWSGEAAEAAALRTGADRRRVNSAADQLTVAASTARRAVDDLRAAKAKLLSTVHAAEAAGLEVGQDFSLTTVESTTSLAELAAREAQMRSLGIAIRADVLALVRADQRAATEITEAANGLRSLAFDDDEAARDRTGFQAVDYHGVPLPEKPPYQPPIPPPEGWSEDPLMRTAQKIAYGHAWDEHRREFPGITSQAQFAEFIHQKLQRAITDPSGLRLGLAKDRAPVIYDPEDRTIIIRDSRSNSSSAGTIFRPPDDDYVHRKSESYVSVFTPDQLEDGPAALAPPETMRRAVEVASPEPPKGANAPDQDLPGGFLPEWGTHVSPDETAKTDGALGILGRIILGQTPPDPHDPASWS